MDTKLDCEVDAEAAADMVVRGEEIQSTPRSARFAPAKVNLPELTVKPFFRPKAVGRGHSVGLREVLSRVLYKILPRTSRPGHDVPVMMSLVLARNSRPGCKWHAILNPLSLWTARAPSNDPTPHHTSQEY